MPTDDCPIEILRPRTLRRCDVADVIRTVRGLAGIGVPRDEIVEDCIRAAVGPTEDAVAAGWLSEDVLETSYSVARRLVEMVAREVLGPE